MNKEVNHNSDGSGANVVAEEWEKLREEEFNFGENNGANIKPLKEDSDPPESTTEKLNNLRTQLREHYQHSEEESAPEEMTVFSGVEIPREYLREDLILIDNLRRRPKFDVVGRKKDVKNLESLIEDGSLMDDEEFAEKFTPTVAQEFVDRFLSGKLDFSRLGQVPRMIEALPLEAQQEIFSSSNTTQLLGLNLILETGIGWRRPFEPERGKAFVYKLSAGLISQLENTEQQSDELNRGLHWALYDSYYIPQRNFAHISEDLQERLFRDFTKNGTSKADAACAFLDQSSFEKHLGDIFSPEERPKMNLFHIKEILRRKIDPNNHVGVLPERASEVVKTLSALSMGAEKDRLWLYMGASEAKKIAENLARGEEVCRDLGLTGRQWGEAVVFYPDITSQIVDGFQIDDKNRDTLSRLFSDPYGFQQRYGKVTRLEDLENLDSFLVQQARSDLERKDFIGARSKICEYAFGDTPGKIGRNLVSLGAIELEGRKRRDEAEAPESFFEIPMNGWKMRLPKGKISELPLDDDEKLLVLSAIDLLGRSDKGLAKMLDTLESAHSSTTPKLGERLERIAQESLASVNRKYSKYMQDGIARAAEVVGKLELDGREIPLLSMVGDDWMLLVHRLGAIYEHKDTENPMQWNDSSHRSRFDKEGNQIGYISTSAIADGAIHFAGDGNISNPEEVFYAFTELGDKSIVAIAEYDLWTDVGGTHGENASPHLKTRRQEHLYRDPRELIERTRQKIHEDGYNEVALDRYSGDPEVEGGRLQPNYIVVFTKNQGDISETVKRQAAYFNAPILMIDPKKYKRKRRSRNAKRQNSFAN